VDTRFRHGREAYPAVEPECGAEVRTGITTVGYYDFNSALPFLVATEPYELYTLPGLPEDIRQQARKRVVGGDGVIGVGFTEPDAGSDMAAFQSHAHLQDDLGSHGATRGSVHFEDVRVPADFLIGERGRAYPMVAEFFDTNRAYIGLKCIGAAQASVDETCAYAKERVSMGKTISHYQGVSLALAEMETQLEAARLLRYKTLWMKDQGMRHSKYGAMVKWWAPEIAFEVVRKCLTLHGHAGYTTELPFEQRLRDIIGWQIGDGTAEVSKLMVARSMMGKEAVG
jgi:alkylation response protein AidB-like acyl-CoA dehydrogenase